MNSVHLSQSLAGRSTLKQTFQFLQHITHLRGKLPMQIVSLFSVKVVEFVDIHKKMTLLL